MDWILAKTDEQGGKPLVFAPGMREVRGNALLDAFTREFDVAVRTGRSGGGFGDWRSGPVLAAWPTRVKLGEIADDPGTKALCVVPWAEGETDAWQAAANPELLGPASLLAATPNLDRVVVAGLRELTRRVNQSNHLAGALDHRDAVAVLRILKKGGYALPPKDVYAWAFAHGWPSAGAERLSELAEKFEAGVRVQMRGPNPFGGDILEVWRAEAIES
jgi:hypothetical protein